MHVFILFFIKKIFVIFVETPILNSKQTKGERVLCEKKNLAE